MALLSPACFLYVFSCETTSTILEQVLRSEYNSFICLMDQNQLYRLAKAKSGFVLPWFGKNRMEHFCDTSCIISIFHMYLCNQLSHIYRNPESVYMFPPPTTWRLLQTKQLSWIIVCNSVGYLGSFCCCLNLFIQKIYTGMKNT